MLNLDKEQNKNCLICGNSMFVLFKKKQVLYLKCRKCGFIVQEPKVNFEQIKTMYNRNNRYFVDPDKQVDYVKGEEWLINTARFYISLLAPYIENYKYRRLNILDVGCATGILIKEFQKDGHNALGVELSQWATEFGQQKYKVNIIHGDLLKKDLPEDHFDVITMMHVIEHCANPLHYLSKIATLLKENGIIVIATPNTDSLGAILFKKYWRYYLPNEHISLFNKKSLNLAMKKLRLQPYKHFNLLYERVNFWKFIKTLVRLLLKKSYLMFPVPNSFIKEKINEWKINRSFCSSKDGIILLSKKGSKIKKEQK